MFHRIGAAAYKADLTNTEELCNELGNPERGFRSIHVAGTNGKGSTSHMLASIFQEAGYKTGLYTSPHLLDFRERIKINGKMIPEETVTAFVEDHKEQFERIKPSFFEWTVALCFDYFRSEKVDIAIIETGLGGRLDSTNVINPLLSIITNISFDHQALLGDTLEKIAIEKAGIIKQNIPVIVGVEDEVSTIFKRIADQKSAPISFADSFISLENKGVSDGYRTWKIKGENSEIVCGLPGLYQQKNIQTVLSSMNVLSKHFDISNKHIANGIQNVIRNTGLYGRWQTLQKSPKIICDTGHNEAGIKEIILNLKEERYTKLHWILGMVNDKDVDKVIKLLPGDAVYYFTKASIPRALDENILAERASNNGLRGEVYSNVESALEAAIRLAKANELIFIGGSTFTVADALSYWKKSFGDF
jgi:dihydrofolate synthase / folylpolyglutamate synthase